MDHSLKSGYLKNIVPHENSLKHLKIYTVQYCYSTLVLTCKYIIAIFIKNIYITQTVADRFSEVLITLKTEKIENDDIYMKE